MSFYARPLEGPERTVERAISDHDGRIRMELVRERTDGRLSGAIFWAYQPGRAIARSSFSLLGTPSPPVIRLTLEQPVKRTITALGADDRPIEGLRLVPRLIMQRTGRSATEIPNELLERLAVTTDVKVWRHSHIGPKAWNH